MKRKITKMFGVGFWLFCALSLCTACAPSFKNVKDVDSFLKKEHSQKNRTSYTLESSEKEEQIGIYDLIFPLERLLRPKNLNNDGKVTGDIRFRGFVDFGKYDVVYRQIPGEPEWILLDEAAKMDGGKPDRPSCELKKFDVEPLLGHNAEYSGGDGQVIIANGVFLNLTFSPKKGAAVPCNRKDMEEYGAFSMRVIKAIETIVSKKL